MTKELEFKLKGHDSSDIHNVAAEAGLEPSVS